ncbi:MAG: tol-pal system-associated acyl-CoA thioesterase [Sedimenticola sp.]|nr:tol-pal system-associated acyl-CoA thioesterase [Sedimenticola sp.]
MKEFLWPVRVYYEDTDSGGVVYYANYLKFMERGRTEWLRELGFEQDELREKEGILFAVRKVEVDYRSPARFNDKLQVSARIISRGKASLTFQQEITADADGRLLCSGIIKIACIGAESFRPTPIPHALLSVIIDGV